MLGAPALFQTARWTWLHLLACGVHAQSEGEAKQEGEQGLQVGEEEQADSYARWMGDHISC
jgi:hypothetical protein